MLVPYLGLPDPLPAYLELAEAGALTGRVSLALWWDSGRGTEQVDALLERAESARRSSLRADTVKIMQDGICENGWAALAAPYANGSDGGRGRLSPEELGARLAAGSDWPVSSPNPVWGMYVAVSRRPCLPSVSWLVPGDADRVLNPAERLSPQEILRACTSGAAHVTGTPATLRVGVPADLTVLSHDVLHHDPCKWEEAKADLTLVGGVPVHDPWQELS